MILEMLYPSHSDLPPELGGTIKGVADELQALLIKKEIGDYAMNKFTGVDKSRRLGDEARQLEVLMMKKKLGLPLHDDDYQEMVNESYADKARHAAAAASMKATREPLFAGVLPEARPAIAITKIETALPQTQIPLLGLYNLAKKGKAALSEDLGKGIVAKMIRSLK